MSRYRIYQVFRVFLDFLMFYTCKCSCIRLVCYVHTHLYSILIRILKKSCISSELRQLELRQNYALYNACQPLHITNGSHLACSTIIFYRIRSRMNTICYQKTLVRKLTLYAHTYHVKDVNST